MANIVIAYHSGFGHTKAIAERVHAGAAGVSGVTATILNVEELPAPGADRSLGGRWGELNAADAIIFGTPTYMGDVSWVFKRFMEYSSGIWFGQGWKDKIAAGFTNSGGLSGDKLQTLQTLMVFANQHSMLWVSTGVTPSIYTGDGKNLNRLSSYSGLMTQADQGPPDQTPPQGDRLTGEAFGARVAQATKRWLAGKG